VHRLIYAGVMEFWSTGLLEYWSTGKTSKTAKPCPAALESTLSTDFELSAFSFELISFELSAFSFELISFELSAFSFQLSAFSWRRRRLPTPQQ